MSTQPDYIIVGAGSAGCVLANRLTENPNISVVLLETGGSDKSPVIQMPSAFSIPMNTKRYNWGYYSAPEPHLNNRRMHCPRGKVLGGSSSINGLVYVRGHACDIDEWAEMGAKTWDYQHCLPYYQKAENYKFGGDEYRGEFGPVSINNGNNRQNPLYQAFIEAGDEAGYGLTDDYNGYQQEGFGPMQMTVKNGVRWSTANAYLRPAMTRPNLTVITHALTQKILLENKKATGVLYERKGTAYTLSCKREVILCAGTIGSPQLLQCSGIGPKAVLSAAGVEVLHDLPGVGENLQDHIEIYMQFRCKQPISINSKLGFLSRAMIGLKWLLFKEGLGATNHFEACGFIRSQSNLKWPDIQYHFLPAAIGYDGKNPVKGHGFMVAIGPNKPKSRGHLQIQAPTPHEHPLIHFHYLSHEDDSAAFRRAVRLTREIFRQPAMDAFCGVELKPGSDIVSDSEIDEYVKAVTESAYHPCGTCRLGEDEMSVVDSNLKVHGIDGLRVVDSSVFPTIPNGNLNAPTIMLAERSADIIKGVPLLAALTTKRGLADDWQNKQRVKEPVSA